MNTLKKIWDWIYLSSADSSQVSLSLKAGVPFLILFLGWAHVGQGIDANTANSFVDALISALVKVAELGTALGAVYGFGRKILLSLRG